MICMNPECPDRLHMGSRGEYREGLEECPKCGARLQAPEPARPEDSLQDPPPTLSVRDTPAGAARIATFPSYEVARFTAERLIAAGLHPVLLVNVFRATVAWTPQFYSPTRLAVPEAEADEARTLVDAQQSDRERAAPGEGARLFLFDGDITTLPVDAIVNAANETLLGGGGVDGAIHDAAGPKLLAECRALGGCRPGEAKLTHGHDLPASWVIHTVGPVWRGGESDEEETLRRCYRACLRIAREKGFESLAFPSISTGAYRYPLKDAARIATEEILRGLREDPDLEVTVVCFSREVRKAYEAALSGST